MIDWFNFGTMGFVDARKINPRWSCHQATQSARKALLSSALMKSISHLAIVYLLTVVLSLSHSSLHISLLSLSTLSPFVSVVFIVELAWLDVNAFPEYSRNTSQIGTCHVTTPPYGIECCDVWASPFSQGLVEETPEEFHDSSILVCSFHGCQWYLLEERGVVQTGRERDKTIATFLLPIKKFSAQEMIPYFIHVGCHFHFRCARLEHKGRHVWVPPLAIDLVNVERVFVGILLKGDNSFKIMAKRLHIYSQFLVHVWHPFLV